MAVALSKGDSAQTDAMSRPPVARGNSSRCNRGGRMADVLTAKQRSYCMSRIRAKNTKPEMVVRRIVHRLGYRFRLHQRGLPGAPDLVLSRLQKVILV